MLNELEYVRNAVRTVQVHIAGILVHESLVPERLEEIPGPHEILNHADVRTGLDVEVTSVEITAHIQARNQLQSLVLGIGLGTLPVKVEMVGRRRSLEITLLERLTVPYPVSLIHEHMVHMDRNPHVGGGVGYLVIDAGIDDEILCPFVAILDVVYARSGHG